MGIGDYLEFVPAGVSTLGLGDINYPRIVVLDLGISMTNIAYVFSNRSLKVSQAYSYFAVPSASGTGTVFSGAGILHSISFQGTATAGTVFWLFDCDGATAGAIGTSASAVARYFFPGASVPTPGGNGAILNAIIGGGLRYRLSAAEGLDGITITYSAAT